MRKYYKLGNEEVFLATDIYLYNGNTQLNATCLNGEPYARLTVNFPVQLESPDLAFLNINLYDVDIEKFITENGLGEKVEGRDTKSGYITYPLYRLNLKRIQECSD